LSRLAATADHISGGRVEAGLGVGWNEEEHRAYGFRFPEAPARMKMLSEGAEIIYRQWTEDVFDYSGTYFVLERCSALPKPVSRVGYPPLIIGGSARQKTAGLAARFAAEYNTTFGATPDACRERRQHLDEACVAVNRDPSTLRFSAMTEFVIGRDSDAVQYRLERIASLQGLDGGQAFLDSDGMHGRSMLVGTPAAILARLEEYRAVGVDRVILQHLLHDDLEALELLAQEILPSIGR
jgi:alkanesulfonate monooxygenase SsuD/methylene tetrahydromethanopterin reductase-like flavin-dependent oxidoreductase (luciferase family)